MDEEKNEINLDNIAEGLGGAKKEKEMPEESLSSENQPIPQVAPKEELVQEEAKPAAAPLEDIFSETEVEKPAALQPKQEEAAIPQEETRGPGKRKLVLLIVVLLLFAGVVAAGYFGYNYYTTNNNSFPFLEKIMESMKKEEAEVPEEGDAIEQEVEQKQEEEEENVNINRLEENPENSTEPEDQMIAPPMMEPSEGGEDDLDTDGDGLPDKDEIVRGMDINSNDTDGDGLFDREEVMVYNTDPINPDTDGDGFLDGAEVDGGYDPKGPGKLYEINR